MSEDIVEAQILKFLKSPDPEVLAITGKWGVGKTFLWKRCLSQSKMFSAKKYSYTSLFGVSSLDELKFAIFENTVDASAIDQGPSLETVDVLISTGRKGAWLAQFVPFLKNSSGAVARAFFLAIRNQLICIDDFERKSSKLEAADVLGLVSFLKEERGCKIVLLLNDDAFDAKEKNVFNKYLEKVVDTTVLFHPSPQKAASLALPENDAVSIFVRERCVALGISNIRVIRKIAREVHALKTAIEVKSEEAFRQIASSVVLFCWAHFQPDTSPSLEFLTTKKAKNLYGLLKSNDLSDREAAWNALLSAYGYIWTDELDLLLIKCVKQGYFDPDILKQPVSQLEEQLKTSEKESSFAKAWTAYHNSFADDQEQVLDALFKSFMAGCEQVSPLNLNGTVRLFKEVGRPEKATQIIDHYVNTRSEPREFFDLAEYPFEDEITEKEVRDAFAAKCATFRDTRDVAELLLEVRNGTEDDRIVRLLANCSADKYYDTFKSNSGTKLQNILEAALQFGARPQASAEMKQITANAREALQKIGEENPLNARRVAKYGVQVKITPAQSALEGQPQGGALHAKIDRQ